MGILGRRPESIAVKDTESGSGDKKATHNPYVDARAEWLERYGSYIKRAHQWRIITFAMAGITALSITGNVMQIEQQKIVPYIVQVDKLGIPAKPVKSEATTKMPREMIQAAVAQCIVNWRTVTVDVDLQKRMLESLSYFVTSTAKGMLKEWYSKNSPYDIAASGKLVQIDVTRLPLPVSKNSWRLEWVETVRSHGGVVLETATYEATVQVEITPPTSESTIMKNPGGIYITNISTAKQLTDNTPKPVEGGGQ